MEKKLLPADLFGPSPTRPNLTSETKKPKDIKKEKKDALIVQEEKTATTSVGKKSPPKNKKEDKESDKAKPKPKGKGTVKKTSEKKEERKKFSTLHKKPSAVGKKTKAAKAEKVKIASRKKIVVPKPKKKSAKVKTRAELEIEETQTASIISTSEPVEKKIPPTEKDKDFIEVEEEEKQTYEKCPVCGEQVPEKAHVCPHCYIHIIKCPYCGRRAGALENPKMITEQRFNRILKQYTLFGLALPSMPIQPILDCSECRSRVIICETCNETLKHSAQSCPICGEKVRHTKLLINPFSILEAIVRRPDALRGLQKLIEFLLASQSK